MTDLLTVLAEPLTYEFVRRALYVAVLAATACAVLSCWLVLLGWSLLGDAVSHAVLPGVVLAYLFGLPFAVGAVAFALLAVALIGRVHSRSVVKEDTAIGVVFTSLFALGLVLISVFPSQIDLNHILFGNILGVRREDVWQVLAITILVLTVLLARRRDLTLFAFDRSHVHALGLSTAVLSAILLGALALTAVVALQAVGVIMVVALLITPGATALLWTKRIRTMLVLAPVIAVTSAVAGIWVSFFLDMASGPAIVLILSLNFAVAYVLGPRQAIGARVWARAHTRRARRSVVAQAGSSK